MALTLPNFCVVLCILCVVLCIVCFVSFSVLFVCICVLYYCHWVTTQLQLNISHRILPYHIVSYHIISYIIYFMYHIMYHISYIIYHTSHQKIILGYVSFRSRSVIKLILFWSDVMVWIWAVLMTFRKHRVQHSRTQNSGEVLCFYRIHFTCNKYFVQ